MSGGRLFRRYARALRRITIAFLADFRGEESGKHSGSVADILLGEGDKPTGTAIDLERLKAHYFRYKRSSEDLQKRIKFFHDRTALRLPKEKKTKTGNRPSVIITSLPGSGTQYIGSTVARALDYTQESSLWVGEFPRYVVTSWAAQQVAKGGLVAAGHLRYDPFNMQQLVAHGLTKIILHICDPRITTYNQMRAPPARPEDLAKLKLSPPTFASLSHEEQLDFFIDGFFKDSIDWLNCWTEFLDAGAGNIEILVTRHEDLFENERVFFQSIFDFYKLTPDSASSQTMATPKSAHLVGQDGWRHAISSRQIDRMNEMIPERLMERYDWTR